MKKLFAAILALVLIFAVSATAFADFGDFAGDSDWGGGWDSGGWDSGWDSGYDWGSDYDYDYDDYNWGYGFDTGSSGGSGSASSGPSTFFEIIVTAIIIIIILAVVFGGKNLSSKTRAKRTSSQPRRTSSVPTQTKTPAMVNDIAGLKARDPNFSESKFLADAANLYVRMQNAWTEKDLSPLQNRLAEELYAKSDRQLQSYIKSGITNHVERISVLSTDIVGCTKDTRNDIITVQIAARIVDYTTNDSTGKLVRGNPNKELFMTYQWTFIRTLGKLTETDELIDDKHCPNCGAPIDLNQSAVCEYCGSVCQSSEYDWVVSDMKGISQRSNG